MTPKNIILFICNWAPHTAYQALQDRCADIPYEIKMVRLPCTGRVSKSLLLKAFEMGADGVAVVGCSQGACRYGSGTDIAATNIEDTGNILEILGLGRSRLRHETCLPEDADALLHFLKSFSEEIGTMGKTPVSPMTEPRPTEPVTVEEIISKHDVYACQDCGKCSSTCPLTLIGKPFSPRSVANAIIAGHVNSPQVKEDIWSCLTCGICYDRCPSAVNFPEFIRDIRFFITSGGQIPRETHDGFFHALMRTMTSPNLKPRKWNWLPNKIRTDDAGKILFFGGCAPYFDRFFKHQQGVNTAAILEDSLRLMNFFDIRPALLEHERCCGHDLLWSGDREHFLKLAALNVEAIHRKNIEEVVTACPECYRTLAHDYPENGISIDFKVTHIYELLQREISKGGIEFKKIAKHITFQDSCRMSRLDDNADLPRHLLSRLKPEGFTEMQEHGRAAVCCGNCAWIGCDSYSKALQVKRLRQAKETGSDLLVTACPKCQIHLGCAMEDPFLGDELRIQMKDLTGIIAETITWE
ncbi:MAG: hydrogenase iron-sulfur subunit [Desulfobacterales bacterium]